MHVLPHKEGVWISPLSGANQSMQAPCLVRLSTAKDVFEVSPSPLEVSSEFLRGIDLYPYAEDESGAWYVRVNDYAAGRCESGLYRVRPNYLSGSRLKADSSIFREQLVKGDITAFCRDPRTGIICAAA